MTPPNEAHHGSPLGAQGVHDILMITYKRAAETRMALTRLLETCDESMRVWIWHNGEHAETLRVSREFESHPRVHRFHHSTENTRLREPTNWIFTEAEGEFVSKVDDDCLVPDGWSQTLRAAHADEPRFGILGCWRFMPEDFDPDLASKKIEQHAGHSLLRNHWVEGSGYVMKRRCVEECGPLREGESFPSYCIRVARRGWINGWYYPFLWQEHMDDPRAPHTSIKNDEDLERNLPLSAIQRGVRTVADWEAQLKNSAYTVQAAPLNLAYYGKWRRRFRRVLIRMGLASKGAAA